MRARSVLSALLICGVAGCSIGTGETVLQLTPLPVDPAIYLTSDAEPPLTLYVSNQSFDDDPVLLTVSIDGVPLVDGQFYVEGQHNWVAAPIQLPPGQHTVTAGSNTGTTLINTFEIPAGEQRWAVLDYWYYPGEGGRYLSWSIYDEPVGFG